ncbi:MAG: hypothetical protein AAFV97_02340 [Bacteroidota bacterium]
MHISNHKPTQLILLFASIPLFLLLQGCEGLTPTYADIESRGKATVAGTNRSMSVPSQAACDAGSDLTQPLLTSQDLDNAVQSSAPSVATQAPKKEVKILLDSLRMQHGERFWECRLQLPSKSKKSDTKLETGSVDTRVTQRTHRTTDQDHNLDANYVSFKYYIRPGFQHSDPIKVVPSLRIYQWQADEKSFTCIEPPINTDLSIHPGEICYRQRSCAVFLLSSALDSFVYYFELTSDPQGPHHNPNIAAFPIVGLLKCNLCNPEFTAYSPNKVNILQTGTISGKSVGNFQGSVQNEIIVDPQEKILELQQKIIEGSNLNCNTASVVNNFEPQLPDVSTLDQLHSSHDDNIAKYIRKIVCSRPSLMLAASGITFLLCKSYYDKK